MKLSIFVCDSPAAMLQQEAEIGDDNKILYRTPDARAETGEITRYLVKPPRSPGATLDSFVGKYILIARL
jgi:hypothetical protein